MVNPVDDALIARLEAEVPGVVRASEPVFVEEPRGKWRGQAGVVVAPGAVEEVAAVLRLASEARVGVVPHGGGTGLVCGQVMPEGPAPIVLSLARMRAIRGVYPEENVAIAEAGATLAEIQGAALEADRLFPLSYGSEGTARIGGALAVNSGGLNVLRYGTARDLCLGIEAVLPDGRILQGLKRLRKDNTGYDIRNLMIGSEGTLGVITAAALRLAPRPARHAAAFLVVPGPAAALALLARARTVAGEAVSAFELISGVGLRFLGEAGVEARHPFDTVPDWMVLTEFATGESADPAALVERVFDGAFEAGEVTDGHVAQSEAQRSAFWRVREAIPEANRKIGPVASHDVSLPLSEIPGFLEEAPGRLADLGALRINAFGHLGDGNLHFNLFPPEGGGRDAFSHLGEEASRIVHDLVAARGGSFSAEHGIGRLKVGDLERYGDPVKLELMRGIKGLFDPLGIMNPGAVLKRQM